MFNYQTIASTGQKYYLSGDKPRIFILSGTHGDEFDIVPLVEKAVEKYALKLPRFLYIPVLSPSAISLKTRKNDQDTDLNRGFFENSNLPEVKEVMALLSPFHFDLVINFHEDVNFSDFYIYDTDDMEKTPEVTNLKKAVVNLGISLYSGLDDSNDPALGNQVTNGYINPKSNKYTGMIGDWLRKENLMKREIMPEIPGQIPLDQKAKIIDIVFETLISPFFPDTRPEELPK